MIRTIFILSLWISSISIAEPPIFRSVGVVTLDRDSGELQPIELYSRMHALVIGVDHYEDTDIKRLTYAVNDAQGVAKVLREEFEFASVKELKNTEATRAGIVAAITKLTREASENDAVLIFFAGHGTQVGKDDKAVGYLVPHDGSLREEKAGWANNISMSTIISDWSRRIPAKHIFYVMDSCYSGLMATRAGRAGRPPRRDLAYLKEMTREPVRVVLTAGMAGQVVLDKGKDGHSVFTGRFLESLRRHSDFVTAMELAVDIKRKVAADAKERGHTQTPDFARLVGLGDFVFVPKTESVEALNVRLKETQTSISKIEGPIRQAELKKEMAELQSRLAAAKKREELRKQAEKEQARQAVIEAQRRQQAVELRRKLSEARAKEVAARAKYMTIDAAMAEVENIVERIKATEMDVDADYAAVLKNLGVEKDLFEKTVHYKARLAKRDKLINEEIPTEKKSRTEGFKVALQILDGKEFLVDRSGVKFVIDTYDADKEVFDITLTVEGYKEEKLKTSSPPEEARKIYQASQQQALLYRVYARLRLVQKEGETPAESELAMLQFSMPEQKEHTVRIGAGYTPPTAPAFSTSTLPSTQPPTRLTLPEGWTTEERTVEVLTPKGKERKKITYYKNSIGMEFVWVPAGKFKMGSLEAEEGRSSNEGPVHAVTFRRGFLMSAHEVTQTHYEKVTGEKPSSFKGASNPVDAVTWEDAKSFLKKLQARDGQRYSLPSESEWEYACRAGSTTPFAFGETLSTEVANYDGNYVYGKGQKGGYREKTTSVGSFPANAWGLYDMHGNVWEWCQDWFRDTYEGAPDDGSAYETNDANNKYRVLRGGSWDSLPRSCRSANRPGVTPGARDDYIGLRVLLRDF